MIFQTEKTLEEVGAKLSDDKKAPIETALGELKLAHASKDIGQIDAAMEKMNKAMQEASEEMQRAQAAGGEQGAAPGQEAKKEDDVEDVEFEEVKEEK